MQHKQTLGRFLGLVLFAGFAALVIGYYVIHKPFTPQAALALFLAGLRLLMAAWITAACGALGRRLIPGVFDDGLARLASQAALGLGLLGLAWLGIGAAGGYRGWMAVGALAGLSAVLRRELRGWLGEWRALAEAWRSAARLGKSLALAAGMMFALALLPALAPPLGFDALVYHLALPQRYLAAGRFLYVPEIMYWGMPQTAEMLYTWGMLLGGAQVSAALGWCFGLLACVGCLGVIRSVLPGDAGPVGVAALLAGYTMIYLLGAAYVDWLVILFGVGWLAALLAFVQEDGARRQTRLLALAGVFAGMALGTKYTAGVLLVCGAAVIAWRSRRAQDGAWRAALRLLAGYALAAALVAAPWLVKNWVYTGNPAYPFLFPAGAMSALRLELYQGGAPFGDWREVVFLPWRATLLGTHNGPGYSAAVGPLLVGLGACALLALGAATPRQKQALSAAGLAVLAGLAVWMVIGRFSAYLLQIRLYLAFFPALAFLAGAGYFGLERFSLPGVRLGRIAAALVLLVMVFNLFEVGLDTLRSGVADVLLGFESEQAYRGANLGQYAPAMQATRGLPPGASALMLWETRSYDCFPACQPDEILDRWLRERRSGSAAGRAPQEILAGWRAAGYTHLLIHVAGAEFIRQEKPDPYSATDWEALDALLASLPAPQKFGRAYELYSLIP